MDIVGLQCFTLKLFNLNRMINFIEFWSEKCYTFCATDGLHRWDLKIWLKRQSIYKPKNPSYFWLQHFNCQKSDFLVMNRTISFESWSFVTVNNALTWLMQSVYFIDYKTYDWNKSKLLVNSKIARMFLVLYVSIFYRNSNKIF